MELIIRFGADKKKQKIIEEKEQEIKQLKKRIKGNKISIS